MPNIDSFDISNIAMSNTDIFDKSNIFIFDIPNFNSFEIAENF